MARIAVLGMGAMGTRMAENLLQASHTLTVWNRSLERCDALASLGARVAKTPADAVSQVDFVFSMVRDDQASKEVWLQPNIGALAALPPEAVAIECSTLSTAWANELAELCQAKARAFLECPVAGSLPQLDTKQLIIMVGGDSGTFEKTKSIIEHIGGMAFYAGPTGYGAATKLVVNAMYATQIAALGELIGMLHQSGFDPKPILEVFTKTPSCSPTVKTQMVPMLEKRFKPLIPIELVEKDVRYAISMPSPQTAHAPVLSAVRESYQHAIDEGFGGDNITGIVQRFHRADSVKTPA